MRTAVHPGLYNLDTNTPVLFGTRCNSCKGLFFPPLAIGCEICGAEANQLKPETIEAFGVLHSVATVHLHHGRGIEAPFAIGEIQLDAGPLIRATLGALVDVTAIGARMQAEWLTVGTADDGSELTEPRFVSVTSTHVAHGSESVGSAAREELSGEPHEELREAANGESPETTQGSTEGGSR
jgi:uncharacterized protein